MPTSVTPGKLANVWKTFTGVPRTMTAIEALAERYRQIKVQIRQVECNGKQDFVLFIVTFSLFSATFCMRVFIEPTFHISRLASGAPFRSWQAKDLNFTVRYNALKVAAATACIAAK